MEKKSNYRKFGKIIYVGIVNKFYPGYQHGYLVLKEVADTIIPYDYRTINLQYGREEVNKRFLELVEKEKPDYILYYSIVDEFELDTFLKVRDISPETISILFYGDDDCMYESYSRFYKLFFDYIIVFQKAFKHLYDEEKNTRAEFLFGTNLDYYYPIKTEKKIDVSFFGIPECNRVEYLRYLIDNGINLRIFGRNWENMPEYKDYYGGMLPLEEFIKKINETKITINFSRNRFGKLHFKGRIFETAMCRSFSLVEYCPIYEDFLKPGKELIMFKTKEELLEKVRYYLANEKEREEIATRAYNRLKKNKMGFYYDLQKFLKKSYKKKIKHFPLPKIQKKMIELSKEDVDMSYDELKEKLKDYDYVCFNNKIIKKNPYKEYLQMYAHEKSKKEISCCSCYLYKENIGIYLYFNPNEVFSTNKQDFVKMLDISTISAQKDYFLNNLGIFRDMFNNKKIEFMTEDNTNFIQIPLVYIPKLNYVKYKNMKSHFQPKFLYRLYALRSQNRLYKDPYIYRLFFEILSGNYYLLWLIINAIKDPYYKQKEHELEEHRIEDQ
jgi:hypothetical protein